MRIDAKQIFATSSAVIDRPFEGARFTRCNATREFAPRSNVKCCTMRFSLPTDYAGKIRVLLTVPGSSMSNKCHCYSQCAHWL